MYPADRREKVGVAGSQNDRETRTRRHLRGYDATMKDFTVAKSLTTRKMGGITMMKSGAQTSGDVLGS